MFLIPIGHEELSIRRLPWVTIAIVAVCVLVQVDAWVVGARREGPLGALDEEAAEILLAAANHCAASQSCPVDDDDEDGLLEALREHRLGDADLENRFTVLETRAQTLLDQDPVYRFGFRPSERKPWTLITSLFTHSGLPHLLGNMLFLYLTGLAIEERWGRWRYLIFYLLGGVVAALAYGLMHPGSSTPVVGASGAIAALMGAFTLLFWNARIRFFYFIWFFVIRTGTFSARAWLVLPLWFLEQLLSLSGELSGQDRVGYSAHVGGFVFGLAAAQLARVVGWDARFREATDVAAGGWTIHPSHAEAHALADRGDTPAALRKLSAYVAQHPDDRSALELGLELGERSSNARVMQHYARAVYPLMLQVEPRALLASYAKLSRLLQDRPLDAYLYEPILAAALRLKDLGGRPGPAAERVSRRPGQPSRRPCALDGRRAPRCPR